MKRSRITNDIKLRETLPLTDDGRGTSGLVRGGPVPAPADLLNHPRYELLEFLGAGGMGVVYKAWHRFMDRCVALKVLNESLLGIPGMVEHFRREVQAAARLSHPNIVHAYDADYSGNTHFLVMEYVEGVDLDRLLNREGRLPIDRACNFVRQAAKALQHAYERGMIHRDIKPHNLMLAANGHIKVLDFGLARVVDQLAAGISETSVHAVPHAQGAETETLNGGRIGTADYIAPEVLRDAHAADIRSDIYSLGCTLYHLLTGKVPCPSAAIHDKLDCHERHSIVPIQQLRGEISPELAQIVHRMLAVDPNQRYRTPYEAAFALSEAELHRPARVMVVDDEPAARFVMSRMLGDQGYAVTCVSNGNEALDRLKAGFRPDLILLDVMMPVMDGWQFLRERESDNRLSAIPVVVVSSTDASPERAIAAGAVDCLHKPVHFDELTAAIDAIHIAS